MLLFIGFNICQPRVPLLFHTRFGKRLRGGARAAGRAPRGMSQAQMSHGMSHGGASTQPPHFQPDCGAYLPDGKRRLKAEHGESCADSDFLYLFVQQRS